MGTAGTSSNGTSLVVPEIRDDESFGELARKLSLCIIDAVQSPLSWDDLRSSKHIKTIQPFIDHLSTSVHHPALVAALLALKGHFVAIESDDDCGINSSRGLACELIAWQFVLTLSERDTLDYLLFELRSDGSFAPHDEDEEAAYAAAHHIENGSVRSTTRGLPALPHERTALLPGRTTGNSSAAQSRASSATYTSQRQECSDNEPSAFSRPFVDLNTLEIAAVSNAKKFLSQRIVQDLIDAIWRGDVVFWDALTARSIKKPRIYRRSEAQGRTLIRHLIKGPEGTDPWTRLRVPRYMKAFEMMFFLMLLGLFLIVSLERVQGYVTPWEIVFYAFMAGFTLQEWNQFVENGAHFFSTDIWNLWDIGIICIGMTFFVLRMIGTVIGHSPVRDDIAFAVLALLSLFLTPRLFSLMSLNKYYGTLVPCLKEMGKQFVRFLGFVLIIHFGFVTTFFLLARGHFPIDKLFITTLKVFFGAGVAGFDVAPQISPYLGLPVMVLFVCLTNQLLITSMMAHISNSLRQVLDSSREEYLYVYSVYVLEASNSDKLTYFFMPLNLAPVLTQPFLFFLRDETAEQIRIVLLKLTHAPIMVAICVLERWEEWQHGRRAHQFDSLRFWTVNGVEERPVQALNKHTSGGSRVPKFGRQPPKGDGWQVPKDLVLKSRRPARDAKILANGISQPPPASAPSSGNGKVIEAPKPQPPVLPHAQPEQQTQLWNQVNANEMEMLRMLKELTTQVQELKAELAAQKQDVAPKKEGSKKRK
ncbi:hypothetical protein PFICI_10036 [Pestalotiopsis fici W106-1]|uniref:Calcium channel YVC1-like C-terminal transmembrane domain-containing protein n=1 Tax=Pestalotiopsis fici (strain W106-1 / CGMCC3.15140) TaxID=1229662 RepID=W3WVX7_PESFW|nr:uncharacterized protein PFICI_10036 [Pestalotiopsis fici W106-1]ETS77974.1 hypothetical protein PFICI_10036 [Pestalotiopsis fici W106-1]